MFCLRVSPKFTKLRLYSTVLFPSESVSNISTIPLNNSPGMPRYLLFYHQHKSSSFLSLHFCLARSQTGRLFPLHQSKPKCFLQSIVHIQLLSLSLSAQIQPRWPFLGLKSHGAQSMVPCNVGLYLFLLLLSYFIRVNFISLVGPQAGTVSLPPRAVAEVALIQQEVLTGTHWFTWPWAWTRQWQAVVPDNLQFLNRT